MALDLTVTYAGQVDPADPAGYPFGQARNITVPGDGTGFPLERQWINDLLGWQQALLVAASLTPTGDPDKVGASQYLDALDAVVELHAFTNLVVNGNATIGTDSGDLMVVNAIATFSTGFSTAGAVFSNGFTVAAGTALIEGPITANGTLTVAGLSGFNGTASFNAPAIFNAFATFDDEAEFNGVTTVDGPLHAAAADFSGFVIFNGPVGFNGAVSFTDPVTLAGNARIRKRLVVGGDGDGSYGPATVDRVWVDTLTGVRTYTIDDTDAADGDEIEFTNKNDTHGVIVKTPGGAVTLATLRYSVGEPHHIRCVRVAGDWQQVHYSLS